MALTSTIYNFDLEISDMDREVYTSCSLALARHPSETSAFMITRLLAYSLEYRENLEFTRGLSESEEPALWAKDLTGSLEAWIEIGSPAPERLHRARKACEHVAIYTTRDHPQQLESYRSAKIYRAETIAFYLVSSELVNGLGTHLTKRNKISLSRNEGIVYCDLGTIQLDGAVSRKSLIEDATDPIS